MTARNEHAYDRQAKMKQIYRLMPIASPKRLLVYVYWHPSARVITEGLSLIFVKLL
jgi:hypothetical protein